MIAELFLSALLPFSLSFDQGMSSEPKSDRCEITQGVVGDALLFNGFTSRLVIPSEQTPTPDGSFTVDVWFCPVAFPKSPCPIVCKQDDATLQGFSLYIDARGRVHFRVSDGENKYETYSNQSLQLQQWSRLTCSFEAGKLLCLAINGREVGRHPMALNAVPTAGMAMWVGRTPVRTVSEYENDNVRIYSSLDGVLDELRLTDGVETYRQVLGQEFSRPVAPQFEPRILPSGPTEALTFGSWYIPLKFYKQWDEQWRGDTPDVVIGFGEQRPFRVVFWRGIAYAPCFVTEKGNWMSNEFVERQKVTKWGCCESMSDKHADFSSVRILENTPARTVVLWRNAPVGVNQQFPYQDEESQWGDWSEETYIFYPDGVGVRKMDVWSSNLTDWYEWCQSLQVLHPNQRPEDVLDGGKIMSVASMDGNAKTFGWDWSVKRTQHEPSIPHANIQVTYLKSKWNPFLILDDRAGPNENGSDGPQIDRYAGKWSDFSAFPWRNHWPVVQDYVIGRYATVADGPAHTYTATQYNAAYYKDETSGKMTKLMLCGCTDQDAVGLLPLAKSWLRAPKMFLDNQEVDYDLTERAYRIKRVSGRLDIRVDASAEHPACGICLLVDGWKGGEVREIMVDGKPLRTTQYAVGHHVAYDGEHLVVWLDLNLTQPTRLVLKPEKV